MKLLEHMQRINRLHEMIKHRRTGTPQELAKRLDLSPSMLYKFIEELKLKEAPIEYSRELRSYYYSQPYLMNITVVFRLLDDHELKDYSGGYAMHITLVYSLPQTQF
ncbi:MAG: HTH domain-containing protein [Daejeonella sp.]|uniref:HTH domain-containing protein n=1 Tax=Daejeonella sp. TaxID=2805397 RepID=UPI003C76F65E